jgi:hypothetical protein
MAQVKLAMFMKNVSMFDGALLISQFGAGLSSVDARRACSTRCAWNPLMNEPWCDSQSSHHVV